MIAQLVEFRPSKPVVHYLLCGSSLTGKGRKPSVYLPSLQANSRIWGKKRSFLVSMRSIRRSSPSFRAYALMVEFRIHDWLKISCRNGLQVQVLLRVIYACVVQMEDTTDLGSVALWYEGSNPFAGNYASVVEMEYTSG